MSWYLDGCLVGALIRPNARKALESALATSSLRMAVGKEMFGTLRVVTLPCFGPLPPPDDDDDEGTADTDDDDPSEEKLGILVNDSPLGQLNLRIESLLEKV